MDDMTIDLDVDYDPIVFLGVPRSYPVEDLEHPQDWADETADEMVEGGDLPLEEREDLVAVLSLIGEHALSMAADGVITYAHFPRVDQDPLVTWLEVLAPPSSVRELVEPDDDIGTVREESVDELSTPTLGAGLRALWLLEVDGVLEASLRYGWIVGETAILVSTITDDVARLVASIPDFDAFVRSITVNPDADERDGSA